MMRWSLCLCAVLFVACTDGGPGTESPAGGTGGDFGNGQDGGAGVENPEGGAGGAGAGAGASGAAGSAGQAGVGGTAAGGMGSGQGGGMDMTDDDGGVDDEGYCAVACTGIPPDEDVVEACNAIEDMQACTTHDTGGLPFPASCRWVTQDSEPCLTP